MPGSSDSLIRTENGSSSHSIVLLRRSADPTYNVDGILELASGYAALAPLIMTDESSNMREVGVLPASTVCSLGQHGKLWPEDAVAGGAVSAAPSRRRSARGAHQRIRAGEH